MALDIKTLGDFIKSTLDLVNTIRGAVLTVEQAASAVDQAGQRAANALKIGVDGRLEVGFADQANQTAIMAKIVDLQARIAATTDAILGADLRAQLADEFFNLASTTDAVISAFVTFTPAEVARISDLIRQANLDTQQRKLMAAVLQGAVSLLEAGLKVAASLPA